MTAKQKKTVGNIIKLLITAGCLVFTAGVTWNKMSEAHAKSDDNCMRLAIVEQDIQKGEIERAVFSTEQKAMHSDIKDIATKQDKLIEHLMRR